MNESSDDDRSALARAMSFGSQATTISLAMVLPGLVGVWLDRKCGTVMVFLMVGMVLGMTLGLLHLIRLGRQLGNVTRQARRGKRHEDPE